MSVALIVEDLVSGGAERVVARLARALAARGRPTFVYCLRAPGGPTDALRAAGVIVRAAHSHGRDLGLVARLLRWMRHDRVDVVHAHSCAAYVWALPAARWLNRPIVHVRHGALLGPSHRTVQIANRLDRLADGIVVVSEADRQRLPTLALQRRARRIPNGRDLAPCPPDAARRQLERLAGRILSGPIVLSVGTVCREKNTIGLIHAFATLLERDPAVELICVGGVRDGAYLAAVRQAVDERGVADRVHFPGAYEDAWQLMSGADVFCLSSVTEAMPNVIVEAMSQCVPIVATRVGDVPQVLGDGQCGLLVPPADNAALAAGLHEALHAPSAARHRAAAARARYEGHYRLDAMVAAYEAVYIDCMRRRCPARLHRTRPNAAEKPRVVMIGPPASAIGGMTSVVDALLASPLNTRCDVQRFVHTRGGRRRGLRGVTGALWRHFRDLVRLYRGCRTHRAQIVHIHTCSYFSYFRSVLDAIVARLTGARVCLHIHGAEFDTFCRTSRWPLRRLIRSGAEFVDAVIVLSDAWRRVLRPWLGRARLVAIANGVPLEARQSVTRPRACRFVFLGALVARKGVRELIAAAARLRDAGRRFNVILAGPDIPGQEDWRAAVRDTRLDEHIQFAGAVHGAAKDELLRDADCLVLPSHDEGLPMAVLEAAARGIPAIVTSVGALPEFLNAKEGTDTFIAPLVAPGDITALATAMQAMTDSPQRRATVGRAMHRRVAERYGIEHQAARVFDLYGELVGPASWGRACISTQYERFVGRYLYPLHEVLRGRRTLREVADLDFIARRSHTDMQCVEHARLRNLLCFAHEHLPYYRNLLAQRALDPRHDDPQAILHKLPLLTKSVVRQHTADMRWSDVPGGLIPHTTGGSTGDTLHFHIDRTRQTQDRAARLFMQRQFGVEIGARRMYLWGSPIERNGLPIKPLRDRLLNEVLLNAFDLSPRQLDQFAAQLRRFRPRVLYSYPTTAARLAEYLAEQHPCARYDWMQLVVLTGEEVTVEQKHRIAAVFRCPVAAEYGSREVGLIAHECPAGGLHVISPHINVEVLVDGQAAATGEVGEIVCTTLNTRAQPLIRYRTGDAGRWLDGSCPCGQSLPRIEVTGGRITGFIALPGGRLCHGALSSYVLRDQAGIVEFRTHQRSLEWVEVYLVTNPQFDPATVECIRSRYRRLFGNDLRVDVHCVDRIPPDASGKRRHTISDVAPDYSTVDVVAPASFSALLADASPTA